MSTIDSKEIIDTIIAGNGVYPGDEGLPPVVRIVKYTNAWGHKTYGTETSHEIGRYSPSEYINDPEVYWTRKE
jgi:hypothetical protein